MITGSRAGLCGGQWSGGGRLVEGPRRAGGSRPSRLLLLQNRRHLLSSPTCLFGNECFRSISFSTSSFCSSLLLYLCVVHLLPLILGCVCADGASLWQRRWRCPRWLLRGGRCSPSLRSPVPLLLPPPLSLLAGPLPLPVSLSASFLSRRISFRLPLPFPLLPFFLLISLSSGPSEGVAS